MFCARRADGTAAAARIPAMERARRLRTPAKRRARTARSGAGAPPLEHPPRATPVSTMANSLEVGSLTF